MSKMKKFFQRLEESKQGFLARSEIGRRSMGENQTTPLICATNDMRYEGERKMA